MNIIGFILFRPILLLFISLIFQVGAFAAEKDPVAGLVKANDAKVRLKSSPLFEGRGDGITTCPVTGEKVNKKSLKAEFHGRKVYFCCHGCLKAAIKNPDKYVKATQAEQVQAVKIHLTKAKPIDSADFCAD